MLYRLNKYTITLLFILSFAICSPSSTTQIDLLDPLNSKMIIQVPVADLMSKPQEMVECVKLPSSDITNPLQETQLLLGEHVLVHDEWVDENGKKWLYVSTLQQDHFSFELGWHKYLGWIQADQARLVDEFPSCNIVAKNLLAPLLDQNNQVVLTVSIGTRLFGMQEKNNGHWRITLPSGDFAWTSNSNVYPMAEIVEESMDDLQKNIVATAMEFVGSFYSWGGRTAQNDAWKISSVDCSGLINLAFLAHGLQIPRMSNDQYKVAHKIKFGADLKRGDLVLFDPVCKDRAPYHMTHVMMYLGDDQLLEATFAGESKVRTVSFEKRIGKPCCQAVSGDITSTTLIGQDVDDTLYFVYFSSFFGSLNNLQKLRDDALKNSY